MPEDLFELRLWETGEKLRLLGRFEEHMNAFLWLGHWLTDPGVDDVETL